jgi:hypothetical protein
MDGLSSPLRWGRLGTTSSFADREGERVRARIDLRGNEGLLVLVDL